MKRRKVTTRPSGVFQCQATKSLINSQKAITIPHLAGRQTGNFCSSCARLRRMASPSRHNWRSCQWWAAIHLSLRIYRKAQRVRAALSLSPTGKQVAFTASTTLPINSYTQPDLWVLDLLPNAKPRNLTANFDFDVPGFVIGDSAPPRAGGQNKPIWTADGKGLVALYAKEG